VALLLLAAALAMPGLCAQGGATKAQQIQAHMQKAQQAIRANDFAAAEREFAAVVALDPANLDARGNVGVMRFFEGRWADAAPEFRAVLKAQPGNWKVQAYLGMSEGKLEHVAEARRLLEPALPHLAAGPFATQAGLELAQLDYQSGDLDAAVDVVRILLPKNPKNVDVLYTAARIYADLANRSRDALLLAAPDSGRTRQLMAEMLINRGDARAAVAEYRKALELEPALRGVHFELGEALLTESHEPPSLDAAEKEFRAALAESPRDARPEFRLGTVCSLRKDYPAAIAHYTRALELQPDDGNTQQELGWALFKTGDSAQALEHLQTAVRLDPLLSISHYQLAAVYRKLGREADARRELETFDKLEAMRKQIDQVYIRTRPAFSETDSGGQEPPQP